MDAIQQNLLEQVAGLHEIPAGAYNIRANGQMAGRNTTANIDIVTKQDSSGIDIKIRPGTRNESVHIPVVLSQSGLQESVYNDFFVGEDADVTIIAGCGIHNSGDGASEHSGIHRFFVEKNEACHDGAGCGRGVSCHPGEDHDSRQTVCGDGFLCGDGRRRFQCEPDLALGGQGALQTAF